MFGGKWRRAKRRLLGGDDQVHPGVQGRVRIVDSSPPCQADGANRVVSSWSKAISIRIQSEEGGKDGVRLVADMSHVDQVRRADATGETGGKTNDLSQATEAQDTHREYIKSRNSRCHVHSHCRWYISSYHEKH